MGASEPREALLPHLYAALSMDWGNPPEDVRRLLMDVDRLPWSITDDQENFIERLDGPAHGDPVRDERYRTALARVRALADGSSPLDLDLMVEIQTILLGRPVSVRKTTAFAKAGREAYAWFEGFESMLRRKIAADAVDACHPLVRACRLYLDIIFFHPFEDGNARAARLWFEFVLQRARVAGPPIEDVVLLPKQAGDAEAAWRLVRLAAKRALKTKSWGVA
ncbi:MAG TPA: Fic family protein [Planctomycetota bacterium]|nr:Fic family protein [Planctomycetota bacterium]